MTNRHAAAVHGRAALLALLSRALVLGAMLLSSTLFADLDTSARLQARPCDRDGVIQPPAPAPTTATPHLAVWDAVHLLRVAKCGYETDMLGAFFPLLPAVARLCGGAARLLPWLAAAPEEHVLALGGLAASLSAFCAAAVLLHKLSLRALKDPRLADLSLLLFCFNPASVFYSAAYTESLYAALSFWGLLLLPDHHWAAVAALAAASAARSNGILNCWFLVHKMLLAWRQRGRPALGDVAATALGCLLVLSPYLAMQAYGYWTYCRSALLVPPAWCARRLPNLYSYIQSEYWGVGFLQFYRDPARLPMVATALPVAYLSARGCCEYFSSDPLAALTLGLFSSSDPGLPSPLSLLHARLSKPPAAAGRVQNRRPWAERKEKAKGGYFRPEVAPYVYHWALLTAVALLLMNVHVATRFLSACPPLYWFTAHYISSGSKWRGHWVWAWAGAYTALGCLLFPNHYPWT